MEQKRDGHGRLLEIPGSAERDAEALRLRSRGRTFQEISDILGYGGKGNAHNAIQRAVASMQKEHADEVYAQIIENLNTARRAVHEVLERHHVIVQQGRVVRLGDEFEPLTDSGPTLDAVDRLIKIEDRLAKLHGLDTVKVDVTVEDATDSKIRGLVEELEARNRAAEQALRSPHAPE